MCLLIRSSQEREHPSNAPAPHSRVQQLSRPSMHLLFQPASCGPRFCGLEYWFGVVLPLRRPGLKRKSLVLRPEGPGAGG